MKMKTAFTLALGLSAPAAFAQSTGANQDYQSPPASPQYVQPGQSGYPMQGPGGGGGMMQPGMQQPMPQGMPPDMRPGYQPPGGYSSGSSGTGSQVSPGQRYMQQYQQLHRQEQPGQPYQQQQPGIGSQYYQGPPQSPESSGASGVGSQTPGQQYQQQYQPMQPQNQQYRQEQQERMGGQYIPRRDEESSGASGTGGMRPQFNGAPDVAYGPHEKTQNGITYMCGGVGKEEAAYMKDQAGNYDMLLTFASHNGDYLADVNVDIRDARGNSVLQTNCDGPMMLVNLPDSGNYRVHAETGGYSLNRTAHVSAGSRHSKVARVAMVWPQRSGSFEGPETATGGSAVHGTGRAGSGNAEVGPDYQRDENGYRPRDRMYQDNHQGGYSR